jgi:putative transposase
MRYRFVYAQQAAHRLTRLCQTLGVSRSGYYAWRRRPASARTRANAQLLERLQRLHRQTKARYGAVKMRHALLAVGVPLWSPSRGATAARAWPRSATHATVPRGGRTASVCSACAQPSAPSLRGTRGESHLGGRPHGHRDSKGWLYLAVLLDLYSRRVIGWAMSARPDQHLAIEALRMALVFRRPHHGLIHHTDQGATYTSVAYQHQLAEHGIAASMSRKGNCYDNAVAESFFSTLKHELVHERNYHTREDARAEIFEFIEVFYNRQRLHQTLGYVSPEQFETQNSVPLRGCLRNRG